MIFNVPCWILNIYLIRSSHEIRVFAMMALSCIIILDIGEYYWICHSQSVHTNCVIIDSIDVGTLLQHNNSIRTGKMGSRDTKEGKERKGEFLKSVMKKWFNFHSTYLFIGHKEHSLLAYWNYTNPVHQWKCCICYVIDIVYNTKSTFAFLPPGLINMFSPKYFVSYCPD